MDMPSKDDFSKMSKSELTHYLHRYTAATEEYNLILAELRKKEQIEEIQSAKNFVWSKTAGIAAIVGIVLMIVQILLSIYQDESSKERDAQKVQTPAQNIQQPKKNQVKKKSSSNISSSNTPTKKSK